MSAQFSDPPRLRDAPPKGSAELASLFAEAASELPPDAQLIRLAERLGPLFDAPPPPAASWGGTSALMKAALGVGVVLGGLWLGFAAVRRDKAASPAASSAQPGAPSSTQPRDAAPELGASAAVAGPEALPPTPAARPPTGERDAPSNASASPAGNRPAAPQRAAQSEAALLENARRALQSAPARALALTQQHQQRFPHGLLKQEREVIAIEALRRLGRAKQANERAGSFEQQFPDSAHRRAVEAGPRP